MRPHLPPCRHRLLRREPDRFLHLPAQPRWRHPRNGHCRCGEVRRHAQERTRSAMPLEKPTASPSTEASATWEQINATSLDTTMSALRTSPPAKLSQVNGSQRGGAIDLLRFLTPPRRAARVAELHRRERCAGTSQSTPSARRASEARMTGPKDMVRTAPYLMPLERHHQRNRRALLQRQQRPGRRDADGNRSRSQLPGRLPRRRARR